jgi:hypothetical protein
MRWLTRFRPPAFFAYGESRYALVDEVSSAGVFGMMRRVSRR